MGPPYTNLTKLGRLFAMYLDPPSKKTHPMHLGLEISTLWGSQRDDFNFGPGLSMVLGTLKPFNVSKNHIMVKHL